MKLIIHYTTLNYHKHRVLKDYKISKKAQEELFEMSPNSNSSKSDVVCKTQKFAK